MLNLTINIRSAVSTSEIVAWLHNISDTITGVSSIGKVVTLRLVLHSIDAGEINLLNHISPQIACFEYLPRTGTAATHDSMGWWWNVGLHNAFNTLPSPDYVLHYPFDVDWNFRDGNAVVTRQTFEAFADALEDHDLIVGTFSAFDPTVSSEEHTKNRIEAEVLRSIQADPDFRAFMWERPRSEFFAVRRDFYFEFNGAVPPEKFFNDLTVQFLLYAYRKGKSVSEVPIGTYYVRNDEYTPDKMAEQVGRIKEIIQWAKAI